MCRSLNPYICNKNTGMTEKEFRETDYFEVREYDTLQIAGIKFLYASIGFFVGAFAASITALFYIFH